MKAAHSQSQITERYVHAAQVFFPGAASKGEVRMFAFIDGASQTGTVGPDPKVPDAGADCPIS